MYHVCQPVREIIHSLKLVDYLHVQADNPCYNYYIIRLTAVQIFHSIVSSTGPVLVPSSSNMIGLQFVLQWGQVTMRKWESKFVLGMEKTSHPTSKPPLLTRVFHGCNGDTSWGILLGPGLQKWAATCDFQQCGILTWIDSNEPEHSPFKLRDSKCCSVSSLQPRN